jgi:hypothetical protein
LLKHKNLDDRVFRQVVSERVTDFHKAICTTPAPLEKQASLF